MVTYSMRPGRPADKAPLAEWTKDTFAWGDYVVDAFDGWLAHPQSHVLVAVDGADQPIAVGRGVLLSADELWLQAARVHPDWRRRGIASAVGAALMEWGAELGAKVALLVSEDWNEAARSQIIRGGFRQTATWLRAFLPTEHSGRAPRPPTPGDDEAARLQRVPPAEAGPAYLAWAAGELSRAARNMVAVSWQWRRLHPEDLERAAAHGALLAGPTGWAMAAPREGYLEVGWIQTSPEHGAAHLEALIDRAVADEATALQVMLPAVPWLEKAAAAAGFELETLLLYEKPL